MHQKTFFMKQLLTWQTLLPICLTLGLAPFYPEPHIIGKIRWVAGGAVGMGYMDWFDLLLHGLPWALLVASFFINKKKE